MAEYVNKDSAMDVGTLYDWYISSIDEAIPPVWTDEHIEELLEDFLVIPKDTPAADVQPVKHGKWVYSYDSPNCEYAKCSVCEYARNPTTQTGWSYCPSCGAKMDMENPIGSNARIVNTGTRENPYYQIEYQDNNDGTLHFGYGTKDLDIAIHWLNRYFGGGAKTDGKDGE